jgi:hypothetical protein
MLTKEQAAWASRFVGIEVDPDAALALDTPPAPGTAACPGRYARDMTVVAPAY